MTPGKAHDGANLLTMATAIAVNRALLAGGFRVEGATATAGKGVGKEFPALGAEGESLQAQGGVARLRQIKGSTLIGMMVPTIDRGEVRENPEILALATGQGR